MSSQLGYRKIKNLTIILVFGLFLFTKLLGQSNEDCLMCHEDKELTMERNGKTVRLFMTGTELNNTVHKGLQCAECHVEANPDEFPHSDNTAPMPSVNCASCHKASSIQFDKGIHGSAYAANDPYAPDCKECHGTHVILSATNPDSRTTK